MNVPNVLTLSRFGLTCLFIGLLVTAGVWAKTLALIVFLLACLTDWLDGRLARRRHQTTAFGTLMDPIADKILVLSAFLAFVWFQLIPVWMVTVVIARELLVTGARLLATSRGRVLPALPLGKQKTVSQMLAIIVMLVSLILREAALGWSAAHAVAVAIWTLRVSYAVMLIAVGFTLISGAQFLWANRAVLTHGPDQ